MLNYMKYSRQPTHLTTFASILAFNSVRELLHISELRDQMTISVSFRSDLISRWQQYSARHLTPL
jgi:hypothetical protein